MKLSQVKTSLGSLEALNFELENGTLVPAHFHVTEVGIISKHFIDCSGTVRTEKVANFQLWEANDFDHKLAPKKLLDIIKLSENVLHMEDLEVEVEYQSNTIGKYHLTFNGKNFVLTNTQTNCLATDSCGVPANKMKLNLEVLGSNNSCTPGGGCC
jgi:hypothetical protein